MSFASGLSKGMEIGQRLVSMYEAGQEKRELAEVSKANAEHSTGYTAKDGVNLEALANKGYKIDFDQKANAYTATNEAGDVKTIPMKGVTDFMGERSEGHTDTGTARKQASAEIVGRRNPERGMRMQSMIAQGLRAEKVAAREDKQWAAQDELDEDMAAIDAELQQSFTSSLKQEDGSQRAATADDYLGMTQQRIAKLTERGHMAKAGDLLKEHYALAHIKIQGETKEREAALGPAIAALHSGNTDAAAAFYNKFVPGGDKVTRIETGKDGALSMHRSDSSGRELPPMMFKDRNEAAAMMATIKDPNALYQFSQGEFANRLKLAQEGRANRSEARADRQLALSERNVNSQIAARGVTLANSKERTEAMVELAKEQNGGKLSAAQERAIRAGIKLGGSAGDKPARQSYDPDKVAKALGEVVPAKFEGMKDTTRLDPKVLESFKDFWADGNYNTTDEALIAFMGQQSKERRAVKGEEAAKHKVYDKAVQELRTQGISEADMAATMEETGLTREEVMQQLIEQGVIAPE